MKKKKVKAYIQSPVKIFGYISTLSLLIKSVLKEL
jgi:hypothetical protein